MVKEFWEQRVRLQRILQIDTICNLAFLILEERPPEKVLSTAVAKRMTSSL